MGCLANIPSKYILIAVTCCFVFGIVGISAGIGLHKPIGFGSKTIRSKTNAVLQTLTTTPSANTTFITTRLNTTLKQTSPASQVPRDISTTTPRPSVSSSTVKQYNSCPSGWTAYMIDGKLECFKHVGNVRLARAEATCNRIGATLPLPKSSKENEDIQNAIKAIDKKFDDKLIALGLTDSTSEGEFVDSKGQQITYSNWSPGEPNDFKAREDYVTLIMKTGKWNDYPAKPDVTVICQLDRTSNFSTTIPPSTTQCPVCPNDWTPSSIGGKQQCFKYVGKHEIQKAETVCKSLNGFKGKLPLPESQQENDDLQIAVKAVQSSKISSFIIGLTDTSTEGDFVKSNGQPPLYTNWKPGEPNNHLGKEDHTLLMMDDGKWNDYFADQKTDVICQLECSRGCEAGWTKFTIDKREICLKKVSKDKIEKAVSLCKSVNAKVPLPKNKQEDDDLYRAIRQLGLRSCALDGTDLKKEGVWRDSLGKVLAYTNWQPGQPDSFGKGEDYLHYYEKFNSKWNDIPATFWENIVCQKPPNGAIQATKVQLKAGSRSLSSKNKCTTCPVGWTPQKIDGKQECFKSVGKTKISLSASSCTNIGAKLPLPRNMKENTDFLKAFKRMKSYAYRVPIDLNDVKTEKRFVSHQLAGQPPTFINWGPLQPNNRWGIEDYVFMSIKNSGSILKEGKWYDLYPDYTVDTICQLDCSQPSATIKPKPTTSSTGPFVFHGEAKLGTVKVSGTYKNMWKGQKLSMDKMFDGKLETFWHAQSGEKDESILVEFYSTKTVNKITMKIRKDCCKDRYSFCVRLLGSSKQELKTICTQDKWGKPFLKGKDTIEISTGAVYYTKSVEIKFKSMGTGIAELFIHGTSESPSNFVLKTPTTPPKYNFQVVYDNAQKHSYFKIDASQISNDAHVGFSKFSGHNDKKWEIVLAGWAGHQSVIRTRSRNQGTNLVTVKHGVEKWLDVRSDIRITVTDGEIEVLAKGQPFMKYQDASIVKNELTYFLVSSWPGVQGTWTIKAIQ